MAVGGVKAMKSSILTGATRCRAPDRKIISANRTDCGQDVSLTLASPCSKSPTPPPTAGTSRIQSCSTNPFASSSSRAMAVRPSRAGTTITASPIGIRPSPTRRSPSCPGRRRSLPRLLNDPLRSECGRTPTLTLNDDQSSGGRFEAQPLFVGRASTCVSVRLVTQSQGSLSRVLFPNPLLVGLGTALVVFRLLDLLPNHPQRLLQKRSGLLAVRSFESHGVDLDFASGSDDDFDCLVHDYTPMSTSLMDPFGC